MSTMHSPQDPLFFSHHAFIDKLWSVWQDCHDAHEDEAKMFTGDVCPLSLSFSLSLFRHTHVHTHNRDMDVTLSARRKICHSVSLQKKQTILG